MLTQIEVSPDKNIKAAGLVPDFKTSGQYFFEVGEEGIVVGQRRNAEVSEPEIDAIRDLIADNLGVVTVELDRSNPARFTLRPGEDTYEALKKRAGPIADSDPRLGLQPIRIDVKGAEQEGV